MEVEAGAMPEWAKDNKRTARSKHESGMQSTRGAAGHGISHCWTSLRSSLHASACHSTIRTCSMHPPIELTTLASDAPKSRHTEILTLELGVLRSMLRASDLHTSTRPTAAWLCSQAWGMAWLTCSSRCTANGSWDAAALMYGTACTLGVPEHLECSLGLRHGPCWRHPRHGNAVVWQMYRLNSHADAAYIVCTCLGAI